MWHAILKRFLDGSEIKWEEGLGIAPEARSDDVETVRSVATTAVATKMIVVMPAIDDDDAGTESADTWYQLYWLLSL